MKISVIIPAYNVEKYIKKSVVSALEQKQTGEVIIVDDGSTDKTLNICKELAKKYSKINIVVNKHNLGRSASRNIGMKKSKFSLIALLDAYDYYLKGFFDKVELKFRAFDDVEGVFGAIGAYFYDKKSKQKHIERIPENVTFINFKYNYKNQNLFELLQQKNAGHFSICGLVFKKNILDKIGTFDEYMDQAEDTDFLWRMSYCCKLIPLDKNDLVAMRGVHRKNSVFNFKESEYFHYYLYKKWVFDIPKYNISRKVSIKLFKVFLTKNNYVKKYENITPLRILIKTIVSIKIFIIKPSIAYRIFFIKKNNSF